MIRPKLRAAVYARYSSDNQREASIEDQLEVCRRVAEREGWEIVATYEDRAISGGSIFRTGFTDLVRDAERGRFDIICSESLDRLGRKLADIAALYDRLNFRGVRVYTSSEGRITEIHIGLIGTMAQKFVSDLRDKTWRGQLGRVRAGRIPGGLAYGYAVVPPPPGAKEGGERQILEHESAVVRRIFADYVAGKSPRQIAKQLNAEGVPGPRGQTWVDTTIRGHAVRGTGILNNPIYVGRLVWNRTAFVKDPRTGRRVPRLKDADQHEIRNLPQLRIVDDALWDRARARQQQLSVEMTSADAANRLNGTHRRRFLLSGLLVCGCCGGGYTIVGADRYGCATRKGRGTCENAKTINRCRLEARVLDGLKEHLLAPDMIAEALAAYEAEMAAARRQALEASAAQRRELEEVERKLAGVVRAIEDGAWSETLRGRLAELETRQTQLRQCLAALVTPGTPEIRLHPGLIDRYRKEVVRLEEALQHESIRDEAAELLRRLIAKVVLMPTADAPDGRAATLYGDLAVILTLGERRRSGGACAKHDRVPRERVFSGGSGSQLSVVAGAGFEPAAFRL